MTDGKLLYEQLKTTVEEIGKRLEQEHILSGLGITNLSEIGENSPEIIEEILETGFSRGHFDILFLAGKKELSKMRKRKFPFGLRSYFLPEMFLMVDMDSQKIICTIYDSEIPDGIVEEELEKFVRSQKEIEEKEELKKFVHSQKEIKFDIKHKYR